jgi:O-antigen ligase
MFSPMQLITILLTGSRGGLLGISAVWLTLLLQSLFTRNWRILILCGVGIVMFVFIALFSPALEDFRERARSGLNYQQDVTAQTRLRLWEVGWEMAKDNPLVGVGLRNFALLQSSYGYKGERKRPHNTYIQLVCELGFPGLIAYVVMLLLSLVSLWQIARRIHRKDNPDVHYLALALQAGLCGFMVNILVIGRLYFEVIYWIVISGILLRKLALQSGGK